MSQQTEEIPQVWHEAYSIGLEFMYCGQEPTSSFREAAHNCGMDWGTEEMKNFVTWALEQL